MTRGVLTLTELSVNTIIKSKRKASLKELQQTETPNICSVIFQQLFKFEIKRQFESIQPVQQPKYLRKVSM